MKKQKLGKTVFTFPMPVVLMGTLVEDKPNFITIAWINIASHEPASFVASIRNTRYSMEGFKKHQTFSVNVPSVDLLKKTDRCGIYSGRTMDKSSVFNVFYGDIKTAPLIEECPLNFECKLTHTLDLGSHSLIIGEIMQTHACESILDKGQPNFEKLDPFLYCPGNPGEYYGLGKHLAGAFKETIKEKS